MLPRNIYSGSNLEEQLKVEEYRSHTPLNMNPSDDIKFPAFVGHIGRDSANANSKG